MLSYLRMRLGRNDSGASAVEYGLLVAGIAVLVMLAVFTLGTTLNGQFNNTNACLANLGAGCP